MTYKLIDNELYVARKITLLGYEKEVFKMLDNSEQVSLAKIKKELNMSESFVKEIIATLQYKLGFAWNIKQVKIDKRLFYRLRQKRKSYKKGED